MPSKMLKILSKERYADETLLDKIRSDYKADISEETAAEFEAACENFRQVCADI